MTGDDDDAREPAWHERTPTVVGASVVGLAALGLVYLLVSTLVGEFGGPEQSPQYFLDPSSTSGSRTTSSGSTTTTQTITSTVPPVTSDINPGETTTSSSDTTTSGVRIPPRTRDTDDDEPSTTRSRPRLNETRTVYPGP